MGVSPEELQGLLRAAGEAQQTKIESLGRELNTTSEAVRGFLKILNASEVPVERWPQTLTDIAQRHREMLLRLSALEFDDPANKATIEEAREILRTAESAAAYDRADELLAVAEQADMWAIQQADALARDASEAANRKRHSAAATRAERGELRLTRLDYLQAAQHFKAAANLFADQELELRVSYLDRHAYSLSRHGDERGDNAVLAQATGAYREILRMLRREQLPMYWAGTQHNLSNALRILGDRESGTTRLTEAVEACQQALQEYTQERDLWIGRERNTA
jgi:tetratricopeptide (TPR) repeat protein